MAGDGLCNPKKCDDLMMVYEFVFSHHWFYDFVLSSLMFESAGVY
jgi:hypothetical protein